MIKVNGITVKSTIFPDGTSQIWKLPEGLFEGPAIRIVWNFEAEREIIDLFSLNALIPPNKLVQLHIPYLPYARQDKDISNISTFNLYIFAALINSLGYDSITSVDVHNPELTSKLIDRFSNIEVTDLHKRLINTIKPNYLVFPDKGAEKRYATYLSPFGVPVIVFEKYRHQGSGEIRGHNIIWNENTPLSYKDNTKFLVIDDLCDGGATFISIAKVLKTHCSTPELHLYVTHGGFSKGREVLTDVGYKVYTTNSLIKNVDGFEV